MSVNKKPGIEESLGKLDTILKQLESDDITIEESFKLYQEGIKIVNDVNSEIGKVEKKLEIIAKKEEQDCG